MERISSFISTMNHETPQSLILDLGGNPLSSMEGESENRMLECLGFTPKNAEPERFGKVRRIDERILKALDIDTRSVGEILRPERSQFERISPTLCKDEWGITRTFTGRYWDIAQAPLAGAEIDDLAKYIWPDGHSLDIAQIEAFASEARRLFEEGEYVICAEHPVYGVFELGCWLCGFDDFLVRMYTDEDFVKALFDRVLEYQKAVISAYYSLLGPYIHYTSSGDDFAMQSNAFISPEKFDLLIKPYLRERIQYTKRFTNAKFLHHSCGNVFPLIPSLIGCGVEILNPIQPTCPQMSPECLKAAFGSSIVFHGGLDTQSVLPFGGRESIEEAVHKTVSAMNADGGYIFAAAHNIQDDVPPENVIIMFEAARREGAKK